MRARRCWASTATSTRWPSASAPGSAGTSRWSSPLYLAGESYGTTRGAALADKLQDNGVALSGLILVSCAMDLQSLVFAPRNDLPYALFLPGFACVAQYPRQAQRAARRVRRQDARAAAEAVRRRGVPAALHAGRATLEGRAASAS